jgi:hypothetical protein
MDLSYMILTSMVKKSKEISKTKNLSPHARFMPCDVEKLSGSPVLQSVVFKSCDLLSVSLPLIL